MRHKAVEVIRHPEGVSLHCHTYNTYLDRQVAISLAMTLLAAVLEPHEKRLVLQRLAVVEEPLATAMRTNLEGAKTW